MLRVLLQICNKFYNLLNIFKISTSRALTKKSCYFNRIGGLAT